MNSQRMADTKGNHTITMEPMSELFRDRVTQRQPALVDEESLGGIFDVYNQL